LPLSARCSIGCCITVMYSSAVRVAGGKFAARLHEFCPL
jgi:hypothetical protein